MMITEGYDTFVSRCAEGRQMPKEAIEKIAEGRVWIGGRALELGLVDHIGSLDVCVDAMLEQLDMSPAQVVSYPSLEEEIWEKITQECRFGQPTQVSPPKLDADAIRALGIVKRLRTMNPVQARMEPVEIR